MEDLMPLLELPKYLVGRDPIIETTAVVEDANPGGDIFGGWLLAQMDLAGAGRAFSYVRGRIVTVGVEAMSFHQPVFVGDDVLFFTDIERVGNTSITIKIECWSKRKINQNYVQVTEGLYTYVAIDRQREPISIARVRGEQLVSGAF